MITLPPSDVKFNQSRLYLPEMQDRRLKFICNLVKAIRETNTFPSEPFNPKVALTTIHALHHLARQMFGGDTDPHVIFGADATILSKTLPLLATPDASGISLQELPSGYQTFLNKPGHTLSGQQAALAVIISSWAIIFESNLSISDVGSIYSGLLYPPSNFVLSEQRALLNDRKSLTGVATQTLRERFYFVYTWIEHKKRLLREEAIKLDQGYYPADIEADVRSLYTKLRIAAEKTEREIVAQGNEATAALAVIAPLAVPQIAEASARIGMRFGVLGNPFPPRRLTETEMAMLTALVETGLTDDVWDFLIAMRDEQKTLCDQWLRQLQAEANKWGNIAATNSFEFAPIVGIIEAAHLFLTRWLNTFSARCHRERSPLEFHNNPFMPLQQLRNTTMESEKEFGLALFPEFKSIYELEQHNMFPWPLSPESNRKT